jgi:hypothetical protein
VAILQLFVLVDMSCHLDKTPLADVILVDISDDRNLGNDALEQTAVSLLSGEYIKIRDESESTRVRVAGMN